MQIKLQFLYMFLESDLKNGNWFKVPSFSHPSVGHGWNTLGQCMAWVGLRA